MGLLLYKSDEIFSQKELAENNQVIFKKITDNEIDKAVILNDSEVKFLVMEFSKYENIMKEYMELKDRYSIDNKIEDTEEDEDEIIIPKKQDDLDNIIDDLMDDMEEEIEEIEEIKPKKIDPAKVVPPRPENNIEEIDEPIKVEEIVTYDEVTIVTKGIAEENNKNTETIQQIDNDEKKEEIVEELSEEEEINKALETIQGIDFDDDMRRMAESKIRQKILKARKERALLASTQEETEEEKEEEKEIKHIVEVKNQKKDKALSEFWS